MPEGDGLAAAASLVVRAERVVAGARILFRDLAVELYPGSITAAAGPSGCGKSTLLSGIAVLTDAIEGSILLEGRTPDDWGYCAYRRRVVLTQQRPAFIGGTVEENLERPFRYGVDDRRYRADRAGELMEALRLRGVSLQSDCGVLSEGERYRVSLVRAMLLEPAVYLLDEPTAALDGETARAVEEAIRRDVEERGAAAMVATHVSDRLERWCDEVIRLEGASS